jgi:hypothetical protein
MTPEHLLDDEQYMKALGQYRMGVRRLLLPLRAYGQQEYVDHVEDHFLALALSLHMRLLGEDVPLEPDPPNWNMKRMPN